MNKLQHRVGVRKARSNVGAVGVATRGDPGERDGSSHGSSARPPLRWLTVRPHVVVGDNGILWDILLIDHVGELGLCTETVLVCRVPLVEASLELACWSHGLGLPYRDVGSMSYEWDCVTCDPSAGWPL
jgi:hypothetical protein